ncbi:MAG TPA: hypothetical protein VN213_11835, partial [Solirubrobacteraceae bacterium]|nr:hypothetical protein [Solirubrobacteraceae bacterium]
LAAAWTAYQPVRSQQAGDAAIGRLEAGRLDEAAALAEVARQRNPLTPEPLWQIGSIEQARGRLSAGELAFQDAVELQPSSPETWRRLGHFQLNALGDPGAALRSFRAAYFLDPRNPNTVSDFLAASRLAGVPEPTPPTAPPPEP